MKAEWPRLRAKDGLANERHKAIWDAYCGGGTFEQLSDQFHLHVKTVQSIVYALKHRIALSPRPEYQEMREKFYNNKG